MESKPVRVRFAPSPTGHMHLGSARVALYDYLLARKSGGTFILRIEDTDRKRYVEGAEKELIDGLRWLGLEYDEGPDVGGEYGPYHQTERLEIYNTYAWKLIESGHAYPCFCKSERLEEVRRRQMSNKENPRYDGVCRNIDPGEARKRTQQGEKFVVRFRMPKEGSTTGVDLLRGPITTENSALDDSILLRSDGMPTYHFGAMLDDHLMKISHVIRGSEWLPTFPLHVNVVRAFGWDEPLWIHLSVFLKPSGKGKMSKREAAEAVKDGHSIFIRNIRELGYIPEGVLNWILLMGWGVSEDELMTLDEMIDRFDIQNLTPSPAAINFSKLDHFNGTHIRLLDAGDLASRLRPYFVAAGCTVDDEVLRKIIPLIRERLVTLDDCLYFAQWFFMEKVTPRVEELLGKDLDATHSAQVARKVYDVLSSVEEFSPQIMEPPMRALVEELGLNNSQVFGIIRVAVTGQAVSPPLFESMAIVGREKVLERVKAAISILEGRPG